MASSAVRRRTAKHARRQKYLRIFVLECPDPLDAMQDRSEGPALLAIGRLIGHEVLGFLVRSRRELKETIRYVSSIDPDHDVRREPERPLCLHISAHGNSQGLGFGADHITWNELATAIQPFMSKKMQHKGRRIVVLSACQAEHQKLTAAIRKLARTKRAISPPEYVFCTSGDVEWQNAAVGWTLFYHQLPDVNLEDKTAVQKVLDRIKEVSVGHFFYFRWDEEKCGYRKYASI